MHAIVAQLFCRHFLDEAVGQDSIHWQIYIGVLSGKPAYDFYLGSEILPEDFFFGICRTQKRLD